MGARFGMDYGGTNVKAGLFDARGAVLHFREQPLAEVNSGGELLANLLDLARNVTAGRPVEAAGVAIKGLVNSDRGMVEEDIGAGSLLAGIDLRSAFARVLNAPCVIENDARAYAWGEWKFGAGQRAKTMVCMTLGTGVGCAAVVNGLPYRGGSQLGGLLGGHISIDRNGPPCDCGSRGCLEVFCSATALRRRILDRQGTPAAGRDDTIAEFFARVGRGDRDSGGVFEQFIDDLSLGVVNVIHAYGPDVVVLGGGIMRSAEIILPPLIERVHRMAWTFPRGSVNIRPARLDNRAAAIGAAFFPLE